MRSSEDLLRPFAAVVRPSIEFFVSALGIWYLFKISGNMHDPVRMSVFFPHSSTLNYEYQRVND